MSFVVSMSGNRFRKQAATEHLHRFQTQGEKHMRFLSIYKTVERGVPPSQEEMATMGKLVEEGFKAGWLLATEGCLPSKLGARVRSAAGQIARTQRPLR